MNVEKKTEKRSKATYTYTSVALEEIKTVSPVKKRE